MWPEAAATPGTDRTVSSIDAGIRGRVLEARAGDIVIVPAEASHSFTNPGPGVLRHTAIHEAPVHTSVPVVESMLHR